ncbi:unnamed protein product [Effrenium voratum]|nr:unnamed protein product [Effrenium voratum]
MDDVMRNRVMMGLGPYFVSGVKISAWKGRPMPYFTVAQGLQGLEGGLRTGLPEFSVFIVNTPVMFGTIQGDQHISQRFFRNGSSEWLPTPMPSGFERENTYDIYRMYRYIFSPYVDEETTTKACCGRSLCSLTLHARLRRMSRMSKSLR